MPGCRGEDRVPCRLAIIVGVDVDPAGSDEEAVRVDLAFARRRLAADLRDAIAVKRDVARELGRAGAVEDRPAANDDVVHLTSPASLLVAQQHVPSRDAAQSLAPHGPMRKKSTVIARRPKGDAAILMEVRTRHEIASLC